MIVLCANVHVVVWYVYITGVYASDSIESDQKLYVVEKWALENLHSSIVRPCSYVNYETWYIASTKQVV